MCYDFEIIENKSENGWFIITGSPAQYLAQARMNSREEYRDILNKLLSNLAPRAAVYGLMKTLQTGDENSGGIKEAYLSEAGNIIPAFDPLNSQLCRPFTYAEYINSYCVSQCIAKLRAIGCFLQIIPSVC